MRPEFGHNRPVRIAGARIAGAMRPEFGHNRPVLSASRTMRTRLFFCSWCFAQLANGIKIVIPRRHGSRVTLVFTWHGV